jgi:hypothetical protein
MNWRTPTPATSTSAPSGHYLFQTGFIDRNDFSFSPTQRSNDIKIKKYIKSDFTSLKYESPYRIPTEILLTNYSDYVCESNNSSTFTQHTISAGNYTSPDSAICYARGKWFLATSNAKMWVSSDKVSWSHCATFVWSAPLRKVVACGTNEYVALCKDGKLYYSTNDGVSFSSYSWPTGNILDIFYDDVAGKLMVVYINGSFTTVYLAQMSSISSSTISTQYSFNNSVIDRPYLSGFNKRSDGKWVYYAPSYSQLTMEIQVIDALPTANSWSGTTIATVNQSLWNDYIRTIFYDDHLYVWSTNSGDPGINISTKTNGAFVTDGIITTMWVDTTKDKFYVITNIDPYNTSEHTLRSTSDFVTYTSETIGSPFTWLQWITSGFKDRE